MKWWLVVFDDEDHACIQADDFNDAVDHIRKMWGQAAVHVVKLEVVPEQVL